MDKKYISVFGSWRPRQGTSEYQAAYELSFQLAQKGYYIINGGGSGVMAASTEGALAGGTGALGVMIGDLPYDFKRHKNNPVITCATLYERLEKLISSSQGYVVFSGGTGTLVELSLLWEEMNKGLLSRRPVVCFGDHWAPLIHMFQKHPGFVKEDALNIIQFADSTEEVIKKLMLD